MIQNIFKNRGINFGLGTNIFFCDKIEYKLLFFVNESEYLYFNIKTKQNMNNTINKINILPMNNNINIRNIQFINDSDQNINSKSNNPNSKKFDVNNENMNYSDLINENNKLKEELNNYKKINKQLKSKIVELSNENINLNNQLINATKMLSNFSNKNLPQNNEAINNLIEMIKTKDKEINDLKLKLQSTGYKEKLINFKDIIVINFISTDQRINTGIQCLKTETFAEVEERLYQKYEEFRDTNNNFIAKGRTILRFKKICENNLNDGDKVIMTI